MLPKKPLPIFLVVLFDLLGVGAMLVIFILFHHVLRLDSSTPLQNIVFGGEQTTAEIAVTPEPVEALVEADATPTVSPTPEPTPTPAPGDFSATFPSGETVDEDVYGSYVSDTLRIVITWEENYDAVYFVADIWIKDIQEFKTAFSSGKYGRGYASRPAVIAAENNAILAISGDYYGGRSSGIVIRNGDLYRDTVNSDICILYADGVMESYYEDEFDLEAAIERGAYQGWSFGPKLIDNGQVPDSYNTTSTIISRNPRSAIGYYEPGHYCLITVDGRQSGYSRGMTLEQLSQTFIDLGCVDAYNLDGGQTATMVFDDLIVNQPYKGGRTVSDIIYFGRSDTE